MLPAAKLNQLDGALAIMPPGIGDIMAIAGPASAGPFNTPAAFARGKDLVSNFASGPTVESAAYEIERAGKPVVFVRTHATTAGTYSSVSATFAGTSVPTFDAGTHPDDDYEIYLIFDVGATIGVSGAKYRYSLDGGRTMSAPQALGTANHIIFPNSGGARVNLAAGTLVAGDYLTGRAIAPLWSNQELSDGVTALGNSALKWDFVQVVGPVTAAGVATLDGILVALAAAGKYRWALSHYRRPDIGESEATYAAAFQTEFGSASSLYVDVQAGSAKTLSSISRLNYRRPPSFAMGARYALIDAATDAGEVDLGPLPGVTLSDANGNPEDHDEAIYPGLDDERATTLRTIEGYEGVYCTNPRILAPTGSDFVFTQYRRIMNIGCAALKAYFTRRLNKKVLVDRKTGFILESEALQIESGANAALRIKLLTKGFASEANFVLSRTDAVLSTLTLTGAARITPPGYSKFFSVDIGFNNPALRVVKV